MTQFSAVVERDQRERSPLTLHPAEIQTQKHRPSYPAVGADGHGGLNRSPGFPGMDGGSPLCRCKWEQMRRRVSQRCSLHRYKSFEIVLKVQPTAAKVPKQKLQDHVAAIKTSCARLPAGGRAGRVSIIMLVVVVVVVV